MTEKDDLLCVFPDARDLTDIPINKVKYDPSTSTITEKKNGEKPVNGGEDY